MEVKGAAFATLAANIIVTVLFVFEAKKTHLFAKDISYKGKEMREVIRITSYNVCYTKLLRDVSHRPS